MTLQERKGLYIDQLYLGRLKVFSHTFLSGANIMLKTNSVSKNWAQHLHPVRRSEVIAKIFKLANDE